jgi:hypothetical protein
LYIGALDQPWSVTAVTVRNIRKKTGGWGFVSAAFGEPAYRSGKGVQLRMWNSHLSANITNEE